MDKLREALADRGLSFRPDVLTPVEFGQRLAALCEQAGYTTSMLQREMWDKGLLASFQHVGLWRRGQGAPSQRQLEYVASVLGVDADELTKRREL